jgi:hypothetical protein
MSVLYEIKKHLKKNVFYFYKKVKIIHELRI